MSVPDRHFARPVSDRVPDLEVLNYVGPVFFGHLSRAMHLDHYAHEVAGLVAVNRLPDLRKPQPLICLNASYCTIVHWLHGGILADKDGVLGAHIGPVVGLLLDLALADLVGLSDLELLLPVEGQLPETIASNSGPVLVDEVDCE